MVFYWVTILWIYLKFGVRYTTLADDYKGFPLARVIRIQ